MISRIDTLRKKIHLPRWTVPLALLGLCAAAYGVLLPELGFYWDDWAKTLVHRLFGLDGFWPYYSDDRPLSSWTHLLFNTLLGDKPLYWHILMLLLRWVSALCLWWALSGVWRRARQLALLAAMLFAVYPLFNLQPIAVTFHQQWLQFALYFFSLGCMVQAFRKPGQFWLFTVLSAVSMLAELSITEYMIGIELVRPLLLWFMISEKDGEPRPALKDSLLEVLKRWLPYLLITVVFVIWRIYFMPLSGEDPHQMRLLSAFMQDPLPTLAAQARQSALDTLYVLTDWYKALDIGVAHSVPPLTIASWLFALLCGAAVVVYWMLLDEPQLDVQPDEPTSHVPQALITAVLLIWLGLTPAWIAEYRLTETFHSTRYALPALFGASLFLAVLIDWVGRQRLQKAVLLSLLLALAVIFHIRNANDFRWLWKDQTRFYWQLSWRAPAITSGTAIISEEEPFPDQGLFSISSALNLLYPQPQDPEFLAYWMYTLKPRFLNRTPGEPVSFSTDFRIFHFRGSDPDTLLVYYNPEKGNCLWLLTPEDKDEPELSALTRDWVYLSNLERIEAAPQAEQGYPPSDLFGPEPPHGWCYFYQKGELAWQNDDWQALVEIADDVRGQGYHPQKSQSNTPHEWLHFIEGYAHTARWDDAEELTLQIADYRKDYQPRLCILWQDIAAETEASDAQVVISEAIFKRLQCEEAQP